MKRDDDGKLQKRKIGIFHEEFIKKIKGFSKGRSRLVRSVQVRNIVYV